MSALGNQPLSPLGGRYHPETAELQEFFSEAALHRLRVKVEIEWLIELCHSKVGNTKPLSQEQIRKLRDSIQNFSSADVEKIKLLEETTKHDVKAVEYFVRQTLVSHELEHLEELVHFGCTSEDINNVAYALATKDALQKSWLPAFDSVLDYLTQLAREWKKLPMLARTHGQPATPTTLGKEFAVFSSRLNWIRQRITEVPHRAKFSGATGTYSAHVAAEPGHDWRLISREFIGQLGLEQNPLTTQIEPHDAAAAILYSISHANRIFHNLATDIWLYISIGYLKQAPEAGASGSSTMPHKVNPIRFENAEANLEISNFLLEGIASTLTTSRLQRDLTDSSTQRNIGVAFGHSLLAIKNIGKGLLEVSPDKNALKADLEGNWNVLAEAIQTVMRSEIVRGNSSAKDPYAILKSLTRGEDLDSHKIELIIDKLELSSSAKNRLKKLSPEDYVGLSSELVDDLQ